MNRFFLWKPGWWVLHIIAFAFMLWLAISHTSEIRIPPVSLRLFYSSLLTGGECDASGLKERPFAFAPPGA